MTGAGGGAIGVVIHGGSGRMGRAVAAVASKAEGVVVGGFVDFRRGVHKPLEDRAFFDHISSVEGGVDVVVDFSHPAGIGPLVTALGGTRLALVSGTTGLGRQERAMLEVYSEEAPVLYDENMSYGISVFRKLLRVASPLWRDTADVEIVESHRRGKRDHPSGTAYGLARVLDPDARLVSGRTAGPIEAPKAAARVIHSHSLRIGGVPGEHQVYFATEDELMVISHRALSREAFARGALRAVRFVFGKGPGMYSMEDVAGV